MDEIDDSFALLYSHANIVVIVIMLRCESHELFISNYGIYFAGVCIVSYIISLLFFMLE